MEKPVTDFAPADPQARLIPKLVSVMREGYGRAQFGRDVSAGVVVGIVALPLSIALAVASGVKPEQGLFTAIIAGFLISALGGSRVQIGGPTGAFIVLVYSTVEKYGYAGLQLATMMAGVLLIVMGFARLGAVIRFVPYPVTVGFTTGIAIIIAFSQFRDFLGLRVDNLPAEFIAKAETYARQIGTLNPTALSIGLVALVIVVYGSRITRRVPASLIAILVTTAVVQLLQLPVETIGTRFGTVPVMIPSPSLPEFDLARIRDLTSPAIAIALLAAIESLLSAVVADGMIGTRHRSNMELVAQGVANIASPLFGGICATGAIARTATNVKSGGRTPIAGIVHALTLLLITLFFGSWATLIPLSALAAILLVVAYHMSEWRMFLHLLRAPRSDVLVLTATFLLTVLVDLAVAIEVGVVLAALLFMRRMAELADASYVTGMLGEDDNAEMAATAKREVPPGVEVFQVFGAFFFGAAAKFKSAISRVGPAPKVLVLRLREVHAVDATGLHALEEIHDKLRREGGRLVLSGLQAQPRGVMERAGFLAQLEPQDICPNIDAALDRARAIVSQTTTIKT